MTDNEVIIIHVHMKKFKARFLW